MKNIADLHTHTLASGHAYSTLSEMIHAAAEKQLPVLGVSDHAPAMPGSCSEMNFCNFKVIPRNQEGVRILMGCELNIIDYNGAIDLPEHLLKRMDYTIASLHDVCIEFGTMEQNTCAYLGAMENPYVTVIGHPDDGRYPVDLEALVKAAGDRHKLLEVNNNSLSPQAMRLNTWENCLTMLKFCKKYRVPVLMSSDAHFKTDIWNHRLSEQILKEADFPEELVANSSLELLKEYIPALST